MFFIWMKIVKTRSISVIVAIILDIYKEGVGILVALELPKILRVIFVDYIGVLSLEDGSVQVFVIIIIVDIPEVIFVNCAGV